MLIIKIKNTENIELALKKFKNKVRKTKLIEQLRDNRYYNKPSEEKRLNNNKAIYNQKNENQSDD